MAITQLAQTTLRSVIGKMELDRTFEEREMINAAVVSALDEAALIAASEGRKQEQINIATGERESFIARSEGEKQAQINQAQGEAAATAEAIRKIAAAIEQPGGAQAVQLKVAEKAVDAYAQLAQKNNTMIVPGHMGEVAGLIGTAMTLMRADSAGSAAAPQSSSAASRPGNSTSV